jgi:hypothetical protein
MYAIETQSGTINRNVPIINPIKKKNEEKTQFDAETIAKNQEKFDKIKKFMKKNLEVLRKKKEDGRLAKETHDK